MIDVDATTCVALILTNILHLKPYVKKSQSQNCQESLVLLQFYSILQWKYKLYQSLVKIRYFFTVEKYQFYSHLICIEITACDKINEFIHFCWHPASLKIRIIKGIKKLYFVSRGFSSIKIDYSDYPKSLISRINEVYVFSVKYRFSNILLKKYKHHLSCLFCCSHTCYCVNMVSVMLASH